MNKKLGFAVFLGMLVSSTAVYAEPVKFAGGELSTTLTLATDYAFRGISQTDEKPAVQGSFDYGHESGFYLGVWGSNVDFTDANTEFDFYAGFASEMNNGLQWDVGALYYHYPGAASNLNYDFLKLMRLWAMTSAILI